MMYVNFLNKPLFEVCQPTIHYNLYNLPMTNDTLAPPFF